MQVTMAYTDGQVDADAVFSRHRVTVSKYRAWWVGRMIRPCLAKPRATSEKTRNIRDHSSDVGQNKESM